MPITNETRWVNWNWELRENKEGEQTWTKPPRRPRDLTLAKSNDQATWGSYERALSRYQNGDADGIGFMLLGSNTAAADLDHCCKRNSVKKRTLIDPWAREVRAEAGGAYCEVTVSGEGLRLIGIAAGAKVNRPFKIHNAHPKARLELFRNAERFITVSGLQLGKCPQLMPLDHFIDAMLKRYDRRQQKGEPGGEHANLDYDDLIRNGAPLGDRSELFHAVVWHLARQGLDIEQIVEKLRRYPNGIALKYAGRLLQEVMRSYNKWRGENPLRVEGLPIIRCRDGEIARMVDQAQQALIDAEVPLFVHGGRLVEPITVERQATHDRTTLVTVFAEVFGPKLAYLLNKYAATFRRFDLKRKKLVPTDPPPKLCAALVTLKNWKFPEVVGVVSAPTMRPDGSILNQPGYDPKTRLWCNSDITLPAISEKPTFEEAKQALQLLKHLISGFPFVS